MQKETIFKLIIAPLLIGIAVISITVIEGISASILHINNAEHYQRALQEHWLIGSRGKQVKQVFRRDHRGNNKRRDVTPFDPFTVWRFVKGNVFWGLEVGDGGFISNKNGTNVTYRAEADRHIFIIGGSTVAGAGASSNKHTIAANLELIMRKATDEDVNVVNAGVGGWWSRQEVSWFVNYLVTNYKVDDVIFLNGYNDSWRSTAAVRWKKNTSEESDKILLVDPSTRNKTRLIRQWESKKTSLREHVVAIRDYFFNFAHLDKRSWFVTQLLSKTSLQPIVTGQINFTPLIKEQLEEARNCKFSGKFDISAYLSAIRSATGIAAAHKINLIYALQPSITYKKTLTPPEQATLWKVHNRVTAGGMGSYGVGKNGCYHDMQKKFFNKMSTQFSQLQQSSRSPHVRYTDLSQMFTNSSEDIFYDYAHYTNLGNQKIAIALSKMLSPN